MPGFTIESRIGDIARHPEAREVLERHVPGLVDHEWVRTSPGLRLALMQQFIPALSDDTTRAALLAELGAVEFVEEDVVETPWPSPRADYESDDVELGSAAVIVPASATTFTTAEIALAGPSHGNPYLDVTLSAVVSGPGRADHVVPGFYDGEGTYRLRFLPEAPGTYRVVTSSNARSLDAVEVTVEAGPAAEGAHGPVRVTGLGFAHADGTRAIPLGTTCYAWVHQTTELQEQTLATLATAPFTKLRMCVFPKSMVFNRNEPDRYPYAPTSETGENVGTGPQGSYDKQTFNPDYFRHLEHRVAQLGELGIDADLILFHPYDRWGFADLGRQADEHYLRYVVARLAAYPNVWWSMANEYDLMVKDDADWHRLGRLVRQLDPYDHPTGIHNCGPFFDHTSDWITHSSVQKVDTYRTAENTDRWLREWGKPVVLDEICYEGDLEYGWGNITGEEMVRRFWEGACRGGFPGHGETYLDPEDVLWWAKGGPLKGTSAPRIAFLREVMAALPGDLTYHGEAPGPVGHVVGADGTVTDLLAYLSFMRPRSMTLRLPEGEWRLDVLDTWEMTVEPLPGTHSGMPVIALPARPFMAVRGHRVD